MLIYSVVLHDAPPWSHAESRSPSSGEGSHVKAEFGEETEQQLPLPMSSHPHGLALTPGLLPVHP